VLEIALRSIFRDAEGMRNPEVGQDGRNEGGIAIAVHPSKSVCP
jgi:hypothetical protein